MPMARFCSASRARTSRTRRGGDRQFLSHLLKSCSIKANCYLISAEAKAPAPSTASLGAEIRQTREDHRVVAYRSYAQRRKCAVCADHRASRRTADNSSALASCFAHERLATRSRPTCSFDVTGEACCVRRLSLRLGDASDAVLPQGGELTGIEHATPVGDAMSDSRRVSLSAYEKAALTAEAEIASSGGVYFNTSLYDYQKVRTQARYQATSASLSVCALDFSFDLNNGNPTPGLNYSFLSQQEQASIFWAPHEGKISSVSRARTAGRRSTPTSTIWSRKLSLRPCRTIRITLTRQRRCSRSTWVWLATL